MAGENEAITLRGIDCGELREKIQSLTYHYIYNSQGSDYQCVFCYRDAPRNGEPITHEADCFGEKLLHAIDNS